jgi:hypothetical protein
VYVVPVANGATGENNMANLSDADKKILFGENYKELEKQAQIAAGVTDSALAAQESAAKMDGLAKAAIFFAVLAILIMFANYFATSFPYSQTLQIMAASTLAASVVVNFLANGKKKSILAVGT